MRINKLLTITAGTYPYLASVYTPVNDLSIQMQHQSNSGLGYVFDMTALRINGSQPTPNPATSGHLTAEIAPSSSTAPGGNWAWEIVGSPGGSPLDLSSIAVGGTHTGDVLIVSYDLRI